MPRMPEGSLASGALMEYAYDLIRPFLKECSSLLEPGENSHSESGENRQFWPDENHQFQQGRK